MMPGNRTGKMGNAIVTGDKKMFLLIEWGKKVDQKEK